MAKTRHKKEKEVADLKDRISRSKSIVFTSFKGLDVESMTQLRSTFRQQGVEYQASKKRLLDLSLDDAGIEHESVTNLEGSIAAAFSTQDAVSAAKLAREFGEQHDGFEIQAGLLLVDDEWKYFPKEKMIRLANLPSRDELLAQVARSIKAPVTGFVNVLAGNMRGLVNALNAIKDQKTA